MISFLSIIGVCTSLLAWFLPFTESFLRQPAMHRSHHHRQDPQAPSPSLFQTATCTSTARLRSHLFGGASEEDESSPSFADWFSPFMVTQLGDQFQITRPNLMQQEAIPILMEQQNEKKPVVLMSQTGSGKTITFLGPLLEREEKSNKNNEQHRSLVLAPNALLVAQHAMVADQWNPDHSIAFMTADDFLQQQQKDKQFFHTVVLDEVDALLYGPANSGNLTDQGVQLLTELHQLDNYSSLLSPNVIAVTAYVSNAHQEALLFRDFAHAQVIRDPRQGQMGWMVPTLRRTYQYFSSSNKWSKLQTVLSTPPPILLQLAEEHDNDVDSSSSPTTTMIFCGGVETAQDIFQNVVELQELEEDDPSDDNVNGDQSSRTEVLLLHDALGEESQRRVIAALRRRRRVDEDPAHVNDEGEQKQQQRIVICTDLAVRGLDVPNVQHVILYDVPSDLAAFVHAAGRTARAGSDGHLTCLVQTQSSEMGRYKQLHTLKDASRI